MATLYKHGELGQIERVAYKVAYCADGQVLRNDGDGWKTWRKIKAGIDPKAAFEKAQAAYAEKLATKPLFAEWRKLFHATFAPRIRCVALQAISLMPQDPDGVWSELNDYCSFNGDSFSIEEICDVCKAYQAAELESKSTTPQPATT